MNQINQDKYWQNKLNVDEKLIYSFSLGKGYTNFMLIITSILCLAIFGIGLYIGQSTQQPVITWFSLILSIILLIIFIFYYKVYLSIAYQYALTTKRVLIKEGWIQTRLTSIDYQTLTDVKVYETFADKLFTKTATINLNTAGGDITEGVLKYIQNPYELKKQISKLTEDYHIKLNQSTNTKN